MNKDTVKTEFEILIRTLQFRRLRFKGAEDWQPVTIAIKKLKHFFSERGCRGNDIIKEMVHEKTIRYIVTGTEFKYYSFEALKPGIVDLSLLEPKGIALDNVTSKMMEYLQRTGLKQGAQSTVYFDAFLEFKNICPRLFFSVDTFSGRVHTPVSSLHTPYRDNLTIDGTETTGLDVATMQPLILAKILNKVIGTNDFSKWINSGKDIYILLQERAKIVNRDAAKKRFFQILFSKPNNELAALFNNANWITWINDFKTKELRDNPHSKEKSYSNLAWLLQNTETHIMRSVWKQLINHNIPFLSVHDEIIVKKSDAAIARALFENCLKLHFEYFKINSKGSPEPITTEPITDTPVTPTLKFDINSLVKQIIEPENNYSHDTLIQLISIATGATGVIAAACLSQMLNDGLLAHAKNVNRYYLKNSAPF